MSRLEVLCVAMNQTDFSLVDKLNLHCDAIIANQTDQNVVEEKIYEWGKVIIVSTNTRGVGKNRNIAFLYASGEILLLSDDDMSYSNTYVDDIINEFDTHKDADVIIFNIGSNDSRRKQIQNRTTRPVNFFSRMPYGAPRIAIRKKAWEKSNVWFTTLFGGGAKYTNGEDSIFIKELLKHNLKIYVSNKNIGTVDMTNSSWFNGSDEKFYYNKGAYAASIYHISLPFWWLYHAIRSKSTLPFSTRIKCLISGSSNYRNL